MSIRPPFNSTGLQKWFFAIYAWDFCDPEPLAELVKIEPIPAEFREAVSAIVSGNRTPDKKAAAKLKIPARKHANLVRDLAADLRMRELEKEYSEETANRRRQEPIEVIRYAENAYRARVATVAQQYGVSTETLENILRRIKKRFSDWPAV